MSNRCYLDTWKDRPHLAKQNQHCKNFNNMEKCENEPPKKGLHSLNKRRFCYGKHSSEHKFEHQTPWAC